MNRSKAFTKMRRNCRNRNSGKQGLREIARRARCGGPVSKPCRMWTMHVQDYGIYVGGYRSAKRKPLTQLRIVVCGERVQFSAPVVLMDGGAA